jgi:acyl-CoA synthetase (AMP-forming)/AMP-acid ligase II
MQPGARIHTLADIVRFHARARPDRRALPFEGRETTFRELDARSNQVARALIASGLRPGDRVAHFGKNTDVFFELLFGAAKAGVVLAPVNWRLAPREMLHILSDCAPKLLFVGPEFAATVDVFAAEAKVHAIIGLEAPYRGASYAEWRDAQQATAIQSAPTPADPALMFYTSGTTGDPKGVVLTHRNFIGMQRNYAAEGAGWTQWTDEDASLVATPCFHIAGVAWSLTSLYNGAPIVIVREFDPLRILDVVESQRISKLLLVPAALQIVVRQPKAKEVDFSRLKYVVYGASSIPLDLLRECMTVFGCAFVQTYGMTETSGGIAALGPEDHNPAGNARMRSAGKPLKGVEIAIFGSGGQKLPSHAVGEIATRSVGNMKEYWKAPEATAATIDAEGWLRTGDAGFIDEDGYLFIHDRVKDMIISGGENIYPAEVENAIFGHPAVADVAVIGVPSERWGEEVKAIVVASAGADKDPTTIIAWARERIAGFKAPKSVDFVDSLPRGPSGKILRRELRAPYWDDRERNVN